MVVGMTDKYDDENYKNAFEKYRRFEELLDEKVSNRHDREIIDVAYKLACEAHAGQTRKGKIEPYVNHCVDSAYALLKEGAPAYVVAAELLHDSIEDGELKNEDGTLKPIDIIVLKEELDKRLYDKIKDRDKREYITDKITYLVSSLTEKGKEDRGKTGEMSKEQKAATWRDRKAYSISHIAEAEPETKMMKAGDTLSNLEDIYDDIRDAKNRGSSEHEIWAKFNSQKGKDDQEFYYKGVEEALKKGKSIEHMGIFKKYSNMVSKVFGKKKDIENFGYSEYVARTPEIREAIKDREFLDAKDMASAAKKKKSDDTLTKKILVVIFIPLTIALLFAFKNTESAYTGYIVSGIPLYASDYLILAIITIAILTYLVLNEISEELI